MVIYLTSTLKMLRGCTKSLIACIIMVLVISPISLKSLFITTIIKAIVGMIVYFSVMFILKSDIQKEVIKTVLKIK